MANPLAMALLSRPAGYDGCPPAGLFARGDGQRESAIQVMSDLHGHMGFRRESAPSPEGSVDEPRNLNPLRAQEGWHWEVRIVEPVVIGDDDELDSSSFATNAAYLSADVIARLQRAEQSDLDCEICFAGAAEGDGAEEDALLTPCGHSYCKDCLVHWAEESARDGRKATCPKCRTEFTLGGATSVKVFKEVCCERRS